MRGHERADDAAHRRQHAARGAVEHAIGRRRRGEEVTVTGAADRAHANLPVELQHRAPNEGHSAQHGRVGREVPRDEAVAAVDEYVVVGEKCQRVLAREALAVPHDRHGWVNCRQSIGRRIDLGAPEVVGGVQVLAVQIAEFDDVVIDDADSPRRRGADPRADEVGQYDTAEASGADHEHAGAGECGLRIYPEAGQGELTGVAGRINHAAILAVAVGQGTDDDMSYRIHGEIPLRMPQNRHMSTHRHASPRYRVSEAATLLGVSDDTVRRWAEDGRLTLVSAESGPLLVDGAELARVAVENVADARLAKLAGTGRSSARNRFVGLVTAITVDTVMAQVELQAGPFRVVSLMSAEAVRELGLVVGSLAVASVKATTVVVEAPVRAESSKGSRG